MMKTYDQKFIAKVLSCFYISIILLFQLTSCQDLQEFTLDTIPTPDNLSIEKEGRNAMISWDLISDSRVNGYEVQLGSDSEFSTILSTDTLSSGASSFTFEDLDSEESYAARVRALNPDPLVNSFYGTIAFISNEIENIFRLLTDEHLGIGWVTLRWNEPNEGSVTNIRLTPGEGGDEINVQLTAEEIAAREVRIEGLDINGATYLAEIFDNNVVRGEVHFATLDINASITINDSNDSYRTLQDAIDAAVSGDIINIGNTSYDFESLGEIQISNKSITLKAVSGGEMPEITSQIFNLVGNVETFKLIGLKLIGKSQQIIRFENLIGGSQISIEDCDISGATAGLIYASSSSTATIGFSMNNSILHDFGNVGGDFIDFRNGAISNFEVKNSTFYNLARDFIRIDAAVENVGGKLRFENCTFNNICSNRFIYIRSNSSELDFEKCLLTNKASDGQNGILTVVSFKDSNVFGTFSERYAQYSESVDNMTDNDPEYMNPANGIFTIGNASVKSAGQGDPRWLQ